MNESITVENIKCIRQIGKGSFSNVYLFENEEFIEKIMHSVNSIGYESLFFNLQVQEATSNEITENRYFIIKEIDLPKLVYKYLYKKQKRTTKSFQGRQMVSIEKDAALDSKGISIKPNPNHVWNTASVNITPYSHQPAVGIDITAEISEEEYYYAKLRELIEGEIIILKHMDNANIIRYFNSSVTNDVYSIKMEFCNLGDLYSILKEKNQFKEILSSQDRVVSEKDKYNLKKYRNKFGGFNNKFIKKFLTDTTSGLKYIHDKNIIHRDIKLQNFLVDKIEKSPVGVDLTFKISDFGFSCFDLSEEPIVSENEYIMSSFMNIDSSSIKKKYYKLCGTPYYMAPEMLMNLDKFEQLLPTDCANLDSQTSEIEQKRQLKLYNKKIDLWSFGICLYELLFNILPFSNMSGIDDLKVFYSKKSTQSTIFKNIQVKTTIDDSMKLVLKKLLTINPDDRITTNELHELVFKLSDQELVSLESEDSSTDSNNVIGTLNMDSWLVEEFVCEDNWDKVDSKDGKNFLGLSVDNNFMKWLGLKEHP